MKEKGGGGFLKGNQRQKSEKAFPPEEGDETPKKNKGGRNANWGKKEKSTGRRRNGSVRAGEKR